MDVSIIIINYNTKLLLAECIASIYEQSHRITFEVIVVDNASTDGSETFICNRFPKVHWINSGENLGFGRANNLGASHAQGKYLFLLNSDTLLKNDAISFFFEYMELHAEKEHIGALGCWLTGCDSKPCLSYGQFPSPQSEIIYLWKKLVGIKLSSFSVLDVDYITGADLFVSHVLYNKLQGFDPQYFMYYEETDLQYRMNKLGYKRRLLRSPEIVHLEGGSFSKKGLSVNRFLMSQKSYNYYVRKHFCGLKYLSFRISLIFIRLLLFVTTNWNMKDKLKAYWLVVKGTQA